MSYLSFNNDGIFLHDAADKPQKLISLYNPADNRSDLSQNDLINTVQNNLQKLFNGTLEGGINAIMFLRIAARLMRKPQVHNVLHIGSWSPLDEVLAKVLPQFNPKSLLWNYAPSRPVEKFANVNFIFADVAWGGGYVISPNKFDTIIFSEPRLPDAEILLAPKDWGRIYFAAPKSALPDYLAESAQTFDLDENFSVIELEISPTLRKEIFSHTPQGELDDKKGKIRQTFLKIREVSKKFNELPPPEKNSVLDEYIAELTAAEKILNEIFPALHSDTVKLNFSMFKEFLIDVRLYKDWRLKNRALEDLNRQIKILAQDLNNL